MFEQWLHLPPPRRWQDLRKGSPFTREQYEQHRREDGWDERAAAWDDHRSAALEESHSRLASLELTSRERVLRIAALHQELALSEIGKHVLASTKSAAFPVTTLREINRLSVDAVKVGQLLAGEATERVATTQDLSKLTTEELLAWRKLTEKTLA